MLLKKEIRVTNLEDWPLHYYDIKDINEREDCLEKILEENPTSLDDQKRLHVLHHRFGYKSNKRADNFMKAWLLTKALTTEHVSFINKKRIEKELKRYLRDLCVLDYERDDIVRNEWKNFSEELIYMCIDSSSYKQIAVGLGHVSDKDVAMRIAGDIDAITKKLPAMFSLEQQCEELYEIMHQTYITMLENGEAYWEYYCTNLR